MPSLYLITKDHVTSKQRISDKHFNWLLLKLLSDLFVGGNLLVSVCVCVDGIVDTPSPSLLCGQ